MAALSSMMALQGGMGVASLGGAYAQSMAAKTRGEFEASAFETNARLAEFNADDAIRRGEKEAAQVKTRANKLVGAQRASYAAQGIDISSGSALDVQNETVSLGAMDALTVRNNAWREAWGYKVQANQATMQAGMSRIAGNNQATNTLLTGGMNAARDVLSAYKDYKYPSSGKGN